MPLTAARRGRQAVHDRAAREGYKMDEVDAFLDEVEAELGRLLRDNEELRRRRGRAAESAARRTAPPPRSRPSRPRPQLRSPSPAVAAAAPPPTDAAVKMLELAQRTADEHVNQAKAEAQRILDQARAEHPRTMGDLEGQRDRHAGQGGRAARLRAGVPHPAALLPRVPAA